MLDNGRRCYTAVGKGVKAESTGKGIRVFHFPAIDVPGGRVKPAVKPNRVRKENINQYTAVPLRKLFCAQG